jgi:gluconate kinase
MGSDYRPLIDVDNKDYIENLSKYLTNESKKTLNDIVLGKSVTKRKLEKLRGEVANVVKSASKV